MSGYYAPNLTANCYPWYQMWPYPTYPNLTYPTVLPAQPMTRIETFMRPSDPMLEQRIVKLERQVRALRRHRVRRMKARA